MCDALISLASVGQDFSINFLPFIDRLTQKYVGYQSLHQSILAQLREGYVPSFKSELAGIDSFLEDVDSDLAICDEAIAQTKNALDILKRSRSHLQHAHDTAKALTSPIRRLPADILAEIFSAYIHDSPPDSYEDGYALRVESDITTRVTCTAMELTWVSSFWRKFALSLPTLWSSVYIETNPFNHHTELLDLFREYLSRSKGASLRLYVCLGEMKSGAQAVFDLLLDNSRRWQTASLDLWGPWVAHAKRRLSHPLGRRSFHSTPFPMLEDLKVSLERDDGDPLLDLFSSCPKLKRFTGECMDWTDFVLYDFSDLRDIHMTDFAGDSLGRFFARMPLLQSCCLEYFVDGHFDAGDDEFTGADGYYYSLITSLDITTHCLSPEAWQRLRLPNLTTLEIGLGNKDESCDLADFSSVLLQSGCALQNVSLPRLSVQHTVEFLASHPSISALKLSVGASEVIGNSYHGLFVCLTMGNPLSIVPSLRFLTIDVELAGGGGFAPPSSTLEGWSDDICCLVESRCAASGSFAGGSGLEGFTLSIAREMPEYVRTIGQLIQARLKPLDILL